MDQFIGKRHPTTGAIERHPTRTATGQPYTPGQPVTVVKLDAEHFYVLEPGLGVAPDHDNLLHYVRDSKRSGRKSSGTKETGNEED